MKLDLPEGHLALWGDNRYAIQTRSLFKKAALSSVPVLIHGAAGTGKTTLATQLHQASSWADGPISTLDLMHVSFRDVAQRWKEIRPASFGTLIIENLDQWPLSVQAACMEAWHSQVGRPSFRVITTIQHTPQRARELGLLHTGLFGELDGLSLYLPTLQELQDNLEEIIQQMLLFLSRENGWIRSTLHPAAMHKLSKAHYPENFRDLRNHLRRAAVLADGKEILSTHLQLPDHEAAPAESLPLREMPFEEYKRMIIFHFLEKYNHDVLKVAQKLDIGKSTIYRMLKSELGGSMAV